MGVQSPKPFSENNHSAIFTVLPFFLGLCPKIGVAVGGWGSRVPNKYMDPCPTNLSFFQKNKTKCSKQPKKQNKLNFHFSLSGVPNVRGGWVGSDVWDKVLKKLVFFLTPSLTKRRKAWLRITVGNWWKRMKLVYFYVSFSVRSAFSTKYSDFWAHGVHLLVMIVVKKIVCEGTIENIGHFPEILFSSKV